MLTKTVFLIIIIDCIIISIIFSGCLNISFEGSTNITEPQIITSPGNYVLKNDIVLSGINSGIVITSSNVTLNGNNKTITCSDDVRNYCRRYNCTTFGIMIGGWYTEYGNVTNVTVKNIKITGCNDGIFAYYPYGNSNYIIENSTMENGNIGIEIWGGDRNLLKQNSIFNNTIMGISIHGSDYNRLIKNNVSGSGVADYDLEYLHNEIISETENTDENKQNPITIILDFFANIMDIKGTSVPYTSTSIFGPVKITSPGTYSVQNDITFNDSRSAIIDILSPDVTVDGNNHTIACVQGFTNSNGIRIKGATTLYGNVTNVTVRNFTITGCGSGIYTTYSYGNSSYTIENNTIADCGMGIGLYSGDRNIIRNNLFQDNKYYGLYIFKSSDYNVVENNLITPTGERNYIMNISHSRYTEGSGVLPVGVTGSRSQEELPAIPVYSAITINCSGSYRLQNDISFTDSYSAIKIQVPDVILDGNFHTITCSQNVIIPDKMPVYSDKVNEGIIIQGGSKKYGYVTNVTIKNAIISGCKVGIDADFPYGNSHYIIENSLIKDGISGIVIDRGNMNSIVHNSVYNNRFVGITLTDSDYNTLIDNNVTHNGPLTSVIDSLHNEVK